MVITRKRLYEIIAIADDKDSLGRLYDNLMVVIILLSLVPLMFRERNNFLIILDKVTVFLLITDYILRFYTADYMFSQKSVWSFIRYPFAPSSIINLLAILPSVTYLNNAFGVFRLFRVFRVFRMVKLLNYSKSVTIVINVFKKEKQALITVASLAVIYIFTSALVLYNVEPETFKHFFEAIYWATITLTTVGYGDITPLTTVGRLVTMFSSLFGLAVIALPTVIFTAGYLNEVDAFHNKDKEQ
jgi:voltage-gated potassium channel